MKDICNIADNFNNRYSVSLIAFSWTVGLKCADQRQYLEERNFGFPAWVQFNELLLSIYSGARQPEFDTQFCYSISLCVCVLISEVDMVMVVLILCYYLEDELNFNICKVLRMVFTTLTQKVNWIRDWGFKDVHIVFLGEIDQPHNSISIFW